MYERPSVLKRLIEISTWVSLLLLIPLAGLGFLSESTIPGNPLYPMKRGIEHIVLGFESFDKGAQALYTVYLVDRRFSETEKVLADNPLQFSTANVNDFLTEVIQAKDTINAISDAQQRLLLRQKLLQNITDYRNQLAMQQGATPPVSYPSVQPTPFITPSPAPVQQNQGNNQINSLNQQLQQLQNQIQQDQNHNTFSQTPPSPTPTPSVFPTPTPTSNPSQFSQHSGSPTPTLSVFITPTSTPIPTTQPTPTPTITQQGQPTPTDTPNPTPGGGGFISNHFHGGIPTPTPTKTPTPTISTTPTPSL